METPLLINDFDTNDKIVRFRWFVVIMFVLILLIVFNGFAIHIARESSNATCHQNATVTTLSNYVLLNSLINITISIGFMIGLILAVIIEIEFEVVMTVLALTPLMVFLGLFMIIIAIIGAVEVVFSYGLCKDEVYPVCLISVIVIVYNLLGCLSSWIKACTN